ncbi:hypothetical protein CRV08_08160 [Halarcobacter ebronensis]|uniref:TonB C-terminal domain-containing protein n=1 Tax=Halarcobacter ebronensis TaxID=1462615 RepID=A0A4V1LRH5_9BACT|nr:energy transducer TonB [Halarcobacter ebronensis]RXJ68218.1 hypothetical protein CRV08_08160 [Halarcobacter ebronensis]
MKSIILAFILSIIIHILLIFLPLDFFKKDEKKIEPPKKVEKQSTVKYVKLQPKIVPQPKKEEKVVKQEEIQKPQQFKKVEPKKIVPQKKTTKSEPSKTIPKEPISKPIIKAIPNKEVVIKPQEKRKTIENRSLENFLLSEPVPVNKKMLDKITQSYIDLYGKEYENFTNVQKVFIQNHIRTIVEITRSYFSFPDLAIKMNLNDYNEIEFVLYPNGDISGLKIIKNGEYSVYDKAIIETVQYAYKDYPRPKEPTQIRMFINYITHH